MKCLNEHDGKCDGKMMVVENPITYNRFDMCELHAHIYYQNQDEIGRKYPEIYQPCPTCNQMECIC